MNVERIVAGFLADVDRVAPGLVAGFHLVGSVALGAYRPHASDIDFVAVVSRPPELASLRLPRRPHLDGIYVAEADLARNPAEIADVPFHYERRFAGAGRFELNPVTWHTLAHYGIAVRGARPAVWTDADVLRAWTRENLESYWRRWLARGQRHWTGSQLAWGVLGVPRLLFTLETGDITSKEGAGEWAKHTFSPRWHRIIDECLRLRRGDKGPLYRDPLTRRRDALDFVAAVLPAP